MSSGIFPESDESAIYLSRADVSNVLGTFSRHNFQLEGKLWPSVEHYFQAMKFQDESVQEQIRLAAHPKQARKMGRSRFKKLRADWKRVKTTVMTRAVYTKCRTYPEIAEELLATDNRKLVENSQYDYYWGCGRDRRGDNQYGVVLMNVREKLLQEKKQA
ncbi:NADAR family protein [Oceanicoccus sp. KOV_DT_Chl]|uniref:NADAR family protein n=1 Tax=Oceanicoccus sp. KOV_DT_Chl TaxID=1904639 RepID=UPI000C7DC995|nr:NADAR family protein [Oceanicoccus sp. KOV_DT_Chl]